MGRAITILAALVLLLCTPILAGQGEESKKDKEPPNKGNKVSQLMHQKLEHSQKILEGVALNDCDKIAKHGRELLLLSKMLEWNVLKTPQYELHSNDFRRTVESLNRSAKDNNLDAAALAYVEMALTCVRCHKYVREVRMARLD